MNKFTAMESRYVLMVTKCNYEHNFLVLMDRVLFFQEPTDLLNQDLQMEIAELSGENAMLNEKVAVCSNSLHKPCIFIQY